MIQHKTVPLLFLLLLVNDIHWVVADTKAGDYAGSLYPTTRRGVSAMANVRFGVSPLR